MHTVINNTPEGYATDHKDHDTLNNQCYNLRTATQSQNNCNQGKRKDNLSGYKGVSWHKSTKQWRATIRGNGKYIHLGSFANAEDAAREYDKAAIKYFGEFAFTNF